MPNTFNEQEKPENFEYLFGSLPEGIQSEDARRIEADYRLRNLGDLIAGGEWIIDDCNNVIPYTMCEEDRAIVASCAVYSIIEKVPQIDCVGASQIRWTAVGSVLSGDIVLYSDFEVELDFRIEQSTIANSAIRVV